MTSHVVDLPGPVLLVPANNLAETLERKVRDHPDLPADLKWAVRDLSTLSAQGGVPATVAAPQNGKDPSLLLYGRTYVLRLYPTTERGGYVVATADPIRLRDHQRVAAGCLLLRPASWQLVDDARRMPPDAAQWMQVLAAWQKLEQSGTDERTGDTGPAPAHAAFLDTLDLMIDATETITMTAARSRRPFPYRDVSPAGEAQRTAVHTFQLAGRDRPDQGEFVRVRSDPDLRGQVTRIDRNRATVRFDQPVGREHLPGTGELEPAPSGIVFDKQREAVDALRTGSARNTGALPAVVEHRVRRVRAADERPASDLDADQLKAFRRALTVPDLLLVVGPPGTGKTTTISEIARACAAKGERVLVTSHTNRAVDNVLARLPRSVVAVRVGNEGSVTAEGQPYLLENRVAALRAAVTDRAGKRGKAGAPGDGDAARWAAQLDGELRKLAEIAPGVARARDALATARRAVGGADAAKVDALAAELRKCREAASRESDRAARMTSRRDSARARAVRPVLGAVYGALARRSERRRAAAAEAGAQLRDTVRATRRDLEEAERALDTATRSDPAVGEARRALERVRRGQTRSRKSALASARKAAAAVGPVETPPEVGDDPDTLDRELADLAAWLRRRLPTLTARGRLLEDWHRALAEDTSVPERPRESGRHGDRLHTELVRYADVIAATCIGAASRPEVSDVDYDLAIVDEAGQIGVADVLVPLARARRAVLVGDHNQLPPYLDSEVDAWGAGVDDPEIRRLLATSAFERLVDGFPASHVVRLTRQRRMPSAIADFVSAQFYDRKLRTAVRRSGKDALFGRPIAFVDTSGLPGDQRREGRGRTAERWGQRGVANEAEARLLVDLATHYQRRGAEWAVIVPYRAQVSRISTALTKAIGDASAVALNVGTVDAFQGGERDVILYGFTRSNPDGTVGFLSELRRTNVAFTRAKRQLVVVGDLSTLTKATDRRFRDLASALRMHVRERGETLTPAELTARLARAQGGAR